MGPQRILILIGLFLVICELPLVSNSSVSTVTLRIKKENNYPPEFLSPINNIVIPKGNYSTQNPKIITKLYAMDEDSDNETITFSLVGETVKDKFILTNDSLVLVAPVLPRDHFVLVLEATDQGNPPRRSHCSVVVVVQDGNVGLSLPSQLYIIHVSSDTPIGTEILNIPVTDASNSSLTYVIENGNDAEEFAINESSGSLRTVKTLNGSNTQIMVLVSNDKNESVTTSVDIVVTDYNLDKPLCSCDNNSTPDNKPLSILYSYYTAYIGEWTLVNTTIFTVPVTGVTESSDLTYSIVSGNLNNDFYICNRGNVKVMNVLNCTTQSYYHLNITVSNGQEASTVLNILLTATPPDPRAILSDAGDVIIGNWNNKGQRVVFNVFSVIYISVTVVCWNMIM